MNADLNQIADRHAGRILSAVKGAGSDGLTDHELSDELGIYLSSVNATRNRLMNDGKVSKNGERRPTGRGGTAAVWIAA